MDNQSLAGSQHKAAHTHTVKSGRGWILFVAIVNVLIGGGILAFGLLAPAAATEANEDSLVFIGAATLIIGLLFFGLWFWARSSPFPAALTALIIYITLIGAGIVMDPQSAGQGIILKIIIVLGLSKAVQSGYALRKQQEE